MNPVEKFADWPKEFHYLKDGKKATLAALKPAAVIAAGPDPGVINSFESEGMFYEWAAGLDVAEKVREAPRVVAGLRKRQGSDLKNVMASQQRRVKAISAEAEVIAKELGKPVGSPEVLSIVTGSDRLRGPLFDPMLLWDTPCGGPNCYGSGAWLPVFAPMPDLGWFGYNDRASHVWASGLNVLCENPWWGGRWAWIFGFWSTHFDLRMIAFDNVASSTLLF